jgi:hypothetical protein
MTARPLVLALALALLMPAAGCRRKPVESSPAATLVRSSGAVWRALPDGSRQPIGGALGDGDVVATGEDGGAVVLLAPGREIELRPNARLKLRRENGQLVAELQSGLVVSRATGSDVVLTVLTPFGITRVPAGHGEATIAVDKNGVVIQVTLGQVAFIDASGKTVTANAPESIEVNLGHVELVKPPPSPPPPEHLDVLLSSESGSVLVRAPGGRDWVSRRAAPAPAGTGFRVGAGRARLMAPGLRGRLEPQTQGRMGEAARSGEGRRFELQLDRGGGLFALEGGQAHALVLEGKQPITLRATEPTTFSVSSARGRSTVVVLAGRGEVSVGDARRQLGPNERLEIAGEKLSVGARPSAEVVLPTARGLHVYADALTDVTLSWAGPKDEVLVEVASDPEFKDVLLAGKVTGNSITVPAPRRADLYWRVTGPGDRSATGHARFEPDRRRSVLDLDHPHNLVSESGPMTTIYFQGVVPTLTFQYAARAGAVHYRLRVYRASDVAHPLIERVVNETRTPIEANALVEGSYLWHAVPLDARGTELAGGKMNKLELIYENALTRLAIGSPKPNEVATGPEVAALGVAPLGSKLYINGRPARLDDKGRFSEKVGRAPTMVFRLITKNGSESYWIRKLRGPS